MGPNSPSHAHEQTHAPHTLMESAGKDNVVPSTHSQRSTAVRQNIPCSSESEPTEVLLQGTVQQIFSQNASYCQENWNATASAFLQQLDQCSSTGLARISVRRTSIESNSLPVPRLGPSFLFLRNLSNFQEGLQLAAPRGMA
jgi:hypothetical protein